MEFTISSKQHSELIEINDKVEEIVEKSGVKQGMCIVYVPHATAALLITESADPNICQDILKTINKIIPLRDNYKHDRIDNNAAAHIKASIIGPSESIPIKDGKLTLGTWQNIMLCDFDGPRERKIIVSVISNK